MKLEGGRKRRIGFLIYDEVTALDVVGPMEAFHAALKAEHASPKQSSYELVTVAPTKRRIVAESGVCLLPEFDFKTCPKLDTLVVPGGNGLRRPQVNATVSAWIGKTAGGLRRVASVCTGIYGLASTGLLDGRKVTTHWRFARDLAQRFPALKVEADALFLKDGKFYTSAGITAGVDLCLALIDEDLGRIIAMAVARELVVYLRRPGGQSQYSEPLRFQSATHDKAGEVDAYIRSHLDGDLSVASLARVACLSERHFARLFKEANRITPAAHVEVVRLDQARLRLSDGKCRIDLLAASLGFGSDDAFRRAFERSYGLTPSLYRKRFGSLASKPVNKRKRKTT